MRRADRDATTRMIEQVEIHLKYEGPDVDNGTMAVKDVILVLQGLSGAYASIASVENSNLTHRIKLSAVRQGSADIVLEVHQWLADNAVQIGATAGLVAIGHGVAIPIVKKIFEVIRIKKHIGSRPSKEHISVENGIAINNSDNVQIIVPLAVYELFKNGKLDKDLERLTRPLQEGRINSAEFEVRADDGESFSEQITIEDRPFFELKDLAVTTTTQTHLVVTLNSLRKSTNSGHLYLNGNQVFYRYVGDDVSKLYSIFGGYSGPVTIRCEAKLDDKLEVLSVEIYDIDRMQMDMFEDASSTKSDDEFTGS